MRTKLRCYGNLWKTNEESINIDTKSMQVYGKEMEIKWKSMDI